MYKYCVAALFCALFLPSCSKIAQQSQAEKLEFPATELLYDLVTDLGETRKKWVGRRIEFQFRPSTYEQIDGGYRLNGQDTPFYCDVDKQTWEKVSLRKAAYYIIVRGTVGEINLDEPIALNDCEVVSLSDEGWSGRPRLNDQEAASKEAPAAPAVTGKSEEPAPLATIQPPAQPAPAAAPDATLTAMSEKNARCKVVLPTSDTLSGRCLYKAFAGQQFEVVLDSARHRYRVVERPDGLHNMAVDESGSAQDLGRASQQGACWVSDEARICAWAV